MGIIVAIIFLTQMSITLLSAFLSNASSEFLNFDIYLYFNFFHRLLIKWGSWILLFTNFVPISLIVSLEMVKYIQGINISKSKFNTQKPAEVVVQTSSLNEELGQIQHIFSDKTGTLTKNHMNFKYMTVGT
jgi:phospholipid-transporting ATPase